MSDTKVSGGVPVQTMYNASGDVNVADLAMAVGIETMNVYDNKVKQYYNMVHQENVEMQNMNNAMNAANTAASTGAKDGDTTFDYTDPQTGKTSTMSVDDYMDQQGISRPSDPDHYYSKDEWNLCMQNIKTASDSLSSQNQQDMMELQSTLNKDNAAAQQASDIMSKANQTTMAIIGNLR